jgi:hypothetical protein
VTNVSDPPSRLALTNTLFERCERYAVLFRRASFGCELAERKNEALLAATVQQLQQQLHSLSGISMLFHQHRSIQDSKKTAFDQSDVTDGLLPCFVLTAFLAIVGTGGLPVDFPFMHLVCISMSLGLDGPGCLPTIDLIEVVPSDHALPMVILPSWSVSWGRRGPSASVRKAATQQRTILQFQAEKHTSCQ